ncbi:hypothetical protein ACQY0O_006326 [Thecaphora frezii]
MTPTVEGRSFGPATFDRRDFYDFHRSSHFFGRPCQTLLPPDQACAARSTKDRSRSPSRPSLKREAAASVMSTQKRRRYDEDLDTEAGTTLGEAARFAARGPQCGEVGHASTTEHTRPAPLPDTLTTQMPRESRVNDYTWSDMSRDEIVGTKTVPIKRPYNDELSSSRASHVLDVHDAPSRSSGQAASVQRLISTSRGRSTSLSNPAERVTLPPISSLTSSLRSGGLDVTLDFARMAPSSSRPVERPSAALNQPAGQAMGATPAEAFDAQRRPAAGAPSRPNTHRPSEEQLLLSRVGSEGPSEARPTLPAPRLMGSGRHQRTSESISPYTQPLTLPTSSKLSLEHPRASPMDLSPSRERYYSEAEQPRGHPTDLERLLDSLKLVQDVNRRNGLAINEQLPRDLDAHHGPHLLIKHIQAELHTLRSFSPSQAEIVAADLGLDLDYDVSQPRTPFARSQFASANTSALHDLRGIVARPATTRASPEYEHARWQIASGSTTHEGRPDPALHRPMMMRTASTPSPGMHPSPTSGYVKLGPPPTRTELGQAYPYHSEERRLVGDQYSGGFATIRNGPSVLAQTRAMHELPGPSHAPHVAHGAILGSTVYPDERHQQQLELLDRRRLAGKGMRRVRKRKNEHHQECLGCQAKETPEWRKGPMGPRTLCNACGLLYAKLTRRKQHEAEAAARASGKNPDEVKQELEESPSDKQASLEALRAELSLTNGLRNRSGSQSATFQAEGYYGPRPHSTDPRGPQHFAPYPPPQPVPSRAFSPPNVPVHPPPSATFHASAAPFRRHEELAPSGSHLQNRGRAHTLSHPAARPSMLNPHYEVRIPPSYRAEEDVRLGPSHSPAYQSDFRAPLHRDEEAYERAGPSSSHAAWDGRHPAVRREALSQSPHGWESRDVATSQHRR